MGSWVAQAIGDDGWTLGFRDSYTTGWLSVDPYYRPSWGRRSRWYSRQVRQLIAEGLVNPLYLDAADE